MNRREGSGSLSPLREGDVDAFFVHAFDQTTLRALSEKDVEFLTAMSRDDGPSRVTDVADRMGVSVDYAQKYRRRLIDAGVVESPSRGRLAFAVPYLRDWLQSNR